MASDEQCLSLNLHKSYMKDALKQLYTLKLSLTELKTFKNEYKDLNCDKDKTSFTKLATKLKNYLDNIKLDIENIHCTYLEKYNTCREDINNKQENEKTSEIGHDTNLTSKNELSYANTYENSTESHADEPLNNCSSKSSRDSSLDRNTSENEIVNHFQTEKNQINDSTESHLNRLSSTNLTCSNATINHKINQLNVLIADISTLTKNLFPDFFNRTPLVICSHFETSKYKIVTNFNSERRSDEYSEYDIKNITAERFFRKLELTDKSSMTGSDTEDKVVRRKTRSERNKKFVKNYVMSSESDSSENSKQKKTTKTHKSNKKQKEEDIIIRVLSDTTDDETKNETETKRLIENSSNEVKTIKNHNGSSSDDSNSKSDAKSNKTNKKVTKSQCEPNKRVEIMRLKLLNISDTDNADIHSRNKEKSTIEDSNNSTNNESSGSNKKENNSGDKTKLKTKKDIDKLDDFSENKSKSDKKSKKSTVSNDSDSGNSNKSNDTKKKSRIKTKFIDLSGSSSEKDVEKRKSDNSVSEKEENVELKKKSKNLESKRKISEKTDTKEKEETKSDDSKREDKRNETTKDESNKQSSEKRTESDNSGNEENTIEHENKNTKKSGGKSDDNKEETNTTTISESNDSGNEENRLVQKKKSTKKTSSSKIQSDSDDKKEEKNNSTESEEKSIIQGSRQQSENDDTENKVEHKKKSTKKIPSKSKSQDNEQENNCTTEKTEKNKNQDCRKKNEFTDSENEENDKKQKTSSKKIESESEDNENLTKETGKGDDSSESEKTDKPIESEQNITKKTNKKSKDNKKETKKDDEKCESEIEDRSKSIEKSTKKIDSESEHNKEESEKKDDRSESKREDISKIVEKSTKEKSNKAIENKSDDIEDISNSSENEGNKSESEKEDKKTVANKGKRKNEKSRKLIESDSDVSENISNSTEEEDIVSKSKKDDNTTKSKRKRAKKKSNKKIDSEAEENTDKSESENENTSIISKSSRKEKPALESTKIKDKSEFSSSESDEISKPKKVNKTKESTEKVETEFDDTQRIETQALHETLNSIVDGLLSDSQESEDKNKDNEGDNEEYSKRKKLSDSEQEGKLKTKRKRNDSIEGDKKNEEEIIKDVGKSIGQKTDSEEEKEKSTKRKRKESSNSEKDEADMEKYVEKQKESIENKKKRKKSKNDKNEEMSDKEADENQVNKKESTNKEGIEETSTGKNKQNDDSDSDSSSNNNDHLIEDCLRYKDKNEEPSEVKPFAFLKCIDINKLLDPNIKKQEEEVDETRKKLKKDKTVDHNKSIILLSSSDEENTEKDNKVLLKLLKQNTSIKVINVSKVVKVSSSNEDSAPYTRLRKSKEKNKSQLKEKFAKLRKLKQARSTRRNLKEISTDSSDESDDDYKKKESTNKSGLNITISSDSGDDIPLAKKCTKSHIEKSSSSDDDEAKNEVKTYSRVKKIVLNPNYNLETDVKFKVHCFVPLPRRSHEDLIKNYLDDLEYKEIKSLTGKLKTRTRKNSDSSSTSRRKRKHDKKHKKTTENEKTDDSMSSDASDDNDAIMIDLENLAALTTNGNGIPSPDLFLSDDDEPEVINNSDEKASDNESIKSEEKMKKKESKESKETDENNDDIAEEKVENGKNEDKNGSAQSSDDEDNSAKNDKSKWRKDKLLRTKITETDSEEEEIRFKNKKKKIEEAAEEDNKEDKSDVEIVTKMSSSKKNKRKKRQLGSESDNSSCSDKSSGDLFATKKKVSKESKSSSSSSDSEEEVQEKKKKVRKRIKRIKASDDSSDDAGGGNKDDEPSTRKKIRHVWNRDSLTDTTKAAAKEEEERKKRIADRQKLYNQMFENDFEKNAKVDKLVLDFDEETKEELLSVDSNLVSKLKPHQASGIQFMWTACYESLERTQNTEGSGCILAHCMGLGKTLQVITLIHTLLLNQEKTGMKTVLVVCPLSTVLNWVSEFKKWLEEIEGEQVNVFDLVSYKQPRERLFQLKDWQKYGGVMVMGYDMFRNLSNSKSKRQSKKLTAGFNTCLVDPGPDLVVCDEGHLLKNEKTGISIAMNRLRTLRRIVLTGTPLQNNLKEYYCMVQFVKPNLLGTYKEYLNRFVNPITNGQYTDSTERDIHIMRRRSHVLHKMLDGVVERRDYGVLAPFLPPKHEYVLFITLTKIQVALYKEYLSKYSQRKQAKGMSYLFTDFQELQRICIHPRVLLDKSVLDRLKKDKEDEEDSEGSLRDFIDDGDDSKSETTMNNSTSDEDSSDHQSVKVSRRKTRANPGNIEEPEPEPEIVEPDAWWSKFITGDELDSIKHSSKILLLFEILHQCELIGDKILVFSQSLFSLNLIEYFLAKIDESTQNSEKSDQLGGYQGSWALGLDYFRLDGSTSCDKRATWCKLFNNETNTRARLFLISTRAGGLGINLFAANRVIIFDVSWNPSHDIQSIYRVYRFGQTKPVYIYRFVTFGTMENKIYERQVTKQAISKRVIDEQQIDRHYNQNELAELYEFTGNVEDEERPTPLVPKDRLFADLLQSHESNIFKYHEHNSLLENNESEMLNEEERKAAWEEFENEKKNIPKFDLYSTMMNNGMIETLRSILQKDNLYANYSPAQMNALIPNVVSLINQQVTMGDFSMYHRILEEHKRRLAEQKQMEMQYHQTLQQISSGYANPGMLQQLFKTHPLQTLVNQQTAGAQGSSGGQYFNPFSQNAMAQQPPTISTEIVEIDD